MMFGAVFAPLPGMAEDEDDIEISPLVYIFFTDPWFKDNEEWVIKNMCPVKIWFELSEQIYEDNKKCIESCGGRETEAELNACLKSCEQVADSNYAYLHAFTDYCYILLMWKKSLEWCDPSGAEPSFIHSGGSTAAGSGGSAVGASPSNFD